jgi:hypothetical protein
MTAAELLSYNLGDLDVDRAWLRDQSIVLVFVRILTRGYDTWTEIRRALAGEPDIYGALRLTESRLSFSLDRSRDVRDYGYEQDLRLAHDAKSFGAGTATDSFVFAVEAVRQFLVRSEATVVEHLGRYVEREQSRDYAESRALAAQARAAKARTGFGRRRAERRAEQHATRHRALAQEASKGRADLIQKARIGSRDLVRDTRETLRVLDNWLNT